MNPLHLNITDHAVNRFRERVIESDKEMSDKKIRIEIIKQVKSKFIILGDGVYPVTGSKCAYVIKRSTIVTVIPSTKVSHSLNETKVVTK
jgi:hypothetical protein